MKNYLIIGLVLIATIITLSSFNYYNTANHTGVRVFLSEHKMNGHYYVVASTHDYRGGVALIHSPNCHCKK